LKRREAFFDGSEGPAILRRQLLDGLAGFVERADVAKLDRLEPLVLVEPPQRKPLGSADVGALGVDPAGTVAIEERTRTLCMRDAGGEQLGVVPANGLGLDFEDAQPIDATRAAPAPARESLGMEDVQSVRLDVHRSVQKDDWFQGSFRRIHVRLER
jgi:hypothetical protein